MSELHGLCHICGKVANHTCKVCGMMLCDEHYSADTGTCPHHTPPRGQKTPAGRKRMR